MHLDQLKKQSRELLKGMRTADPGALERLRRSHKRWADTADETIRQQIALHDAQYVLAREHGFSSWPKLKAYAEPSTDSRHTKLFVADIAWIIDRVRGLLQTRQSAGPAAIEQIRAWHPKFADATDEEILRAPFTGADAQLVYAREHGFETWVELTARVAAIAKQPQPSGEPFLTAFDALRTANSSAFLALLQANPKLAKARGTNGNTLLNLAVSLAAPWAIEALLPISEVNDANDRGWTPLHAAAYANRLGIAAQLIHAGADLDAEAHGAGGTPLIAALFWGHREVADLLAQHSTAPSNLRAAAGLGLPDLIDACFNADGTLTPEASAARGFYRPHSGFPDWTPSSHPQQVLDDALVWACKSNRVEVLPRLHRAGARLDADPYRGTPLIWAAVCNRLDTAAWLLDHGADIDQKATFGGLTHGQGITALHLAAQYGHMPMVRFLVERGADLSVKEDLYQATAEGAANFFGQPEVRDYLRAASAL